MNKPPKLNVIFDDRRTDRYDPLITELKKQKIEYEIWPCILRPNVVSAINASFKMVVRFAKEQGLKEVAIAEDDLWFPSDDGWEYFLKSKPNEFDIYIGGTYLIDKPEEFRPPVVKVKDYVGNHCIIISERYYDRWLSMPDDQHCDTANRGNGDFFVCFPFAALQRPCFSANNNALVNYNSILNQDWVRGKFK